MLPLFPDYYPDLAQLALKFIGVKASDNVLVVKKVKLPICDVSGNKIEITLIEPKGL